MQKEIRPIRVEGNIAYVPLTMGYEAIIDACDVPLVEGYNWCAIRAGRLVYAGRNRTSRGNGIVRLHTVITGFAITDHRDGDGLNNRRANLREATHAQNQQNRGKLASNTSGLKGAHWDKTHKTWQAKITVQGRQKHLGCFASPEAAHAAYRAASEKYQGEFGRLE